MTSPHAPAFRVAARLGLATSALMFALIVIGSVVRTTGSGLACPDWPLCHGRLIPPLQFNIFIEWFHRLIALLVSLLLFATVAWSLARRALRARLGGLALLATGLLLVQVLLGALTVWKLLHPSVVSSHLAVALLLFASMLALTLVARAEAGLVSTNHAGLACPDWPTCHGAWFPPLEGLVGLQVLHRWGAYLLVAAMIVVAVRARTAPDPALRAGGPLALGLTLAQVAVGVTNVFLAVPVWLSAVHLALATALLATLVTLTFRAALLPARAPAATLAAAS